MFSLAHKREVSAACHSIMDSQLTYSIAQSSEEPYACILCVRGLSLRVESAEMLHGRALILNILLVLFLRTFNQCFVADNIRFSLAHLREVSAACRSFLISQLTYSIAQSFGDLRVWGSNLAWVPFGTAVSLCFSTARIAAIMRLGEENTWIKQNRRMYLQLPQ